MRGHRCRTKCDGLYSWIRHFTIEVAALTPLESAYIRLIVAAMKQADLCLGCLSIKTGLPSSRVDPLISMISEIAKVVVRQGDCVGCRDKTWIFGFRRQPAGVSVSKLNGHDDRIPDATPPGPAPQA